MFDAQSWEAGYGELANSIQGIVYSLGGVAKSQPIGFRRNRRTVAACLSLTGDAAYGRATVEHNGMYASVNDSGDIFSSRWLRCFNAGLQRLSALERYTLVYSPLLIEEGRMFPG